MLMAKSLSLSCETDRLESLVTACNYVCVYIVCLEYSNRVHGRLYLVRLMGLKVEILALR